MNRETMARGRVACIIVIAFAFAACLLFGCAGAGQGEQTSNDLTEIVEPGSDATGAAVAKAASAGGDVAVAAESRTDRAQELLSRMSTKEKIAQMFMVYAPESKLDSFEKTYQWGGFVFFARDFEKRSPKSFKKTMARCKKAAKLGLFTAVDEEGGTVVRASYYKKYRSSKFASPRDVYKRGGWAAVKKDADAKAKFLLKLGLNTNLAPVADMAYSSSDYIYSRTFPGKAKSVSKFVKTIVKRDRAKGLVSTLKHFPGYGGNANTHTGITHDKRKLEKLERRDLLPFAAGIQAGVPLIMVNHNIVHAFDKKNPASISPKVHKYLRGVMGYEGIIITDGLGMAGVRKFVGSDGEVAVRAVLAGNDMLCTGNKMAKVQYKAVKAAVKKGRITEERLDESVLRILRVKQEYGIIK